MMKKQIHYISDKFIVIVSLIASFVIPFFWEMREKLMTISDLSFPLMYSDSLYHRYLFTWMDKIYPGVEYSRGNMQIIYQTFLFILYKIGLSVNVSQHLFFSIMIFLSAWFFIKILNLIVPQANKWLALILAFFYVFNPYSITVFWGTISLTIISYLFTPMFVYYFYKVFFDKKFRLGSIMGLLFSCLIINSSGNPVFSLVLIVISSVTLLIISLILKDKFFIKLKRTLIFILFYIISNLFWLIGFLKDMAVEAVKVASNNIGYENQPVELIKAVTSKASILEILKLKGFWMLYSQYLGQSYFDYAGFYAKFDKLFIILPALLAFVIYKYLSKKREKNDFIIGYFLLIFLFSIFMICGINTKPGLLFYQLILSTPLGIAIRNPMDKFGGILIVSYVILMGWGLTILVKNKIRALLIFGLLGIFMIISFYPLYSGKIFRKVRANLPSYYTSVPSDYYKVKKILDSDHSNANLYPFPYLEQYYGTVYRWNDANYVGVDPSVYLFDINTIGGANQEGIDIFTNILRGNYGKASQILSDLSVKYILYHKDFDWDYHLPQLQRYNTDQMSVESHFMELSKGMNKIYEGKDLILFKLNNYNPILRAEDTNSLTFHKISTVKYKISLKNVGDKLNIIYNDGFSPDWMLTSGNGGTIESVHSVYNDYGNEWSIDVKKICSREKCKVSNGRYTLEINLEYSGQKRFEYGVLMSVLGLGLLFVFRKKIFDAESKA